MIKFRLTSLGFIYLLFSVLLLFSGSVRGEIFSSVCAAGLTLYILLAIIFLSISICFWKNAVFKIEIKNNEILISPIREKKAFPFLLPAVIPFYCFEFLTDKDNLKSRRLILRIKLNKTETSGVIPQNERGRFFLKYEYAELSDIAGFFSFRFLQREENIKELFIEPVIGKAEVFELPEIFNETFDNKSNLRRNDELYDVRPYIPGDDTRKINWKLFAHTRELSIKQGDFVPPPKRFFTVYINEPVVFSGNEFYKNAYDDFINKAASIAVFLYEHNISFNILFYDNLTKAFQTVSIFADDKTGLEKIKRTFCIPQIYVVRKNKQVENFKLPVLTDEKDKKNCLLCFFMPDDFIMQNYKFLIKVFSGYKNKCAFYFGIKKNTKKSRGLLYSFLFKTQQEKKREAFTAELNECIEVSVGEMRKEGFYAYTI